MQWRIPVTWEMCGVVEVEADTLINAMLIARNDEGAFLLADDKEYVDGSWRLSFNMDEAETVRKIWNQNKRSENE